MLNIILNIRKTSPNKLKIKILSISILFLFSIINWVSIDGLLNISTVNQIQAQTITVPRCVDVPMGDVCYEIISVDGTPKLFIRNLEEGKTHRVKIDGIGEFNITIPSD